MSGGQPSSPLEPEVRECEEEEANSTEDDEAEEVRSGVDEEELQVFDSFRRLFIMDAGAASAAAVTSASSMDEARELPRLRLADVSVGNNVSLGDAFDALPDLFVEPMDQSSSPATPTPDVAQDAIAKSGSVSPNASTCGKDGSSRKSPKRSLASILDEEPEKASMTRRTSSGDRTDQLPSDPLPSNHLPAPPADNNNNDRFTNETPSSRSSRHFSPSTAASASAADLPLRDSPKRPSEDQPEGNKASPKRLSLQFRPDRISSTSTPFGLKIPAKGVRALSFDNQPLPLRHAPPPTRKTRLSSLGSNADYSLESIAENHRCNHDDGAAKGREGEHAAEDPFPSPSDQSSIIAHGFPSSFFYSPSVSEARCTSGASVGARSKEQRASMPGITSASPSTQRFREALSVEITRRLSLDQASSAGSFLPFASSPSKHPMMTRSSSSSIDKDPEVDSSKWPVISKASLYSLYEALSQESGYWTRSRCRDVTTESQLASGSQLSDAVPSLTSSSHAHHVNAPFCCVPDTPSQLMLRRPVAKYKRETEKIRAEEKARRKREVAEKMADYLGNLRSLPPTLWIGRRVGLEKVDIITELHQLEPCLVYDIMARLDDASLKSFSLVSSSWKSAVDEHKISRDRLEKHDDLVLAYKIQTRENTPLDCKMRPLLWASRSAVVDGSSFGHYSTSSDLNRSFLGGSSVSYVDDSFASVFTPDQQRQRVALKPVLRQTSLNAARLVDDISSSSKQTQSPRSRLSRPTRSPRASTSQSPSRSETQSPSRRAVSIQSPSRRNAGFQSPTRRDAGFQSPSRRGVSGNVSVSHSPRSPFGRVLSPCRAGAQTAPRFGQRRLFTSPTKKDAGERGNASTSFAPPDTVPPNSASATQISDRPKLLISALTNNANHLRASPLPSSLESSSRRLFDSPTKAAVSSGYDLRSQGTTTSSTDAKNYQMNSHQNDQIDDTAAPSPGAFSADWSCREGLNEMRDYAVSQAAENTASTSDQGKTPFCASNYQPTPSALSNRRSLSNSHNKNLNKSLNKSKQKLRRL